MTRPATRQWLVSIDESAPVLLSMAQYVEAVEAAQRSGRREPRVVAAKCA